MTDPHPPARIVGLDVVRAVALIGVCTMNYHGYLIHRGGSRGTGVLAEVLDPWGGPLSTRFAATFVVVAGMGVSLMTAGTMRTGHTRPLHAHRLVLVRRGVALLAGGFVLDWVWPGTILFFYGGYFLVAAAVVALRDRWLVMLGVGAAFAASAIRWWALARSDAGHETAWLLYGDASTQRSPRDLVLDLMVRGTHPLLPWLAFFLGGLLLGRRLPLAGTTRINLVFGGMLATGLGYALEQVLTVDESLRSTDPFEWALPYTLSTGGTALVVVLAVSAAAERWQTHPIIEVLAATGRTTLSLYVLHALVFNLVVDWLGWVEPGPMWTGPTLAVAFWIAAVMLSVAWLAHHRHGPLESAYRAFSR